MSTENVRFAVFVLVSLLVFLVILRFVTRQRAVQPAAIRIAVVAAIVVRSPLRELLAR